MDCFKTFTIWALDHDILFFADIAHDLGLTISLLIDNVTQKYNCCPTTTTLCNTLSNSYSDFFLAFSTVTLLGWHPLHHTSKPQYLFIN